MIEKWNNSEYGPQNYLDMWGNVETAINKKKTENEKATWFVSSKLEWAAFGYNLKIEQNNFVTNYSEYGLKADYWTSSNDGSLSAHAASCEYTSFYTYSLAHSRVYVRLSATF